MKHLQNVRYTIAAIAAVATMGLISQANAQTEPVAVEVEVLNTLTITEVTPLNFGTIAAARGVATTSTIAMPITGILAAPTNNLPSSIAVIDAATASEAEITVEDGAPSANININIPIASITAPTFGGNSFALSSWVYAWNGGGSTAIVPGTPQVVQFDAGYNAGVNALHVGATLGTTAGAVAYGDGAYTGGFSVVFSY